MAEESKVQNFCCGADCAKVATMQCPTCVKLKGKPHYFCDQDCFKANWKTHSRVHATMKKVAEFVAPPFRYTGPLRPWYVSPPGIIPAEIPKTDYYMSGFPLSEQTSKARNTSPIYSAKEIEGIRAACKIGRGALDAAGRAIRAGVTPEELDQIVHKYIIDHGAYPSPYNYHNFPKSVCISVNEVICHGIPDHRPLEEGDIVNIDVTAYYKGFHGDLNETFCVGKVDYESMKLVKTSYDSLFAAIATVRPGTLFRDFGNVITEVANKAGFSVVKSYCGHGIGSLFHCAPNVPHYERNKASGTCQAGMVFTIEPMINAGTWKDETWPDEWTAVTADGKRSAQFEHTMLVTEDGVELLTARTEESAKLWWELDENKEHLARYEAEMQLKK